MEGFLSWRTLVEVIVAIFLLLFGSRLRLFEKKDERISNAKIDAQSKILNYCNDCFRCLDEIKIKINANIIPDNIKCADEYRNFQQLETQFKLVCGFANILDDEKVIEESKSCLKSLNDILSDLKNRDGIFWDDCRKLEINTNNLLDSVTTLKI
jgi:hypothetical protein